MAMSDLPSDVLEEVFSRVPLKSLRAVRTTCKKWNTLSKRRSFTKKKEFQTIMMKDCRAYIMSVNIHGVHREDNESNFELSIDQKGLLKDADKVDISSVFHCSGLLLCTTKEEKSRLVVLNPYHGQPTWIEIEPIDPRLLSMERHMHALGYEEKKNSRRSHKILRITEFLWSIMEHRGYNFEIYNFNSDSWKEVDCHTSGWTIPYYNSGVSLKGNTYWFVRKGDSDMDRYYGRPPCCRRVRMISEFCLKCFDFTNERFGRSLPLPFKPSSLRNVTLSSVRDTQLAVLYKQCDRSQMEIWITTKIEPEAVSWSMFLAVDMKPLIYCQFPFKDESFFVDEEKKVVVIFDKAKYVFDPSLNVAYIIGNDGYFKRVDLGECTDKNGCKLMCSYVPSSVQINH